MMQATFGAGCFWGVEAAFRRIPGVVETAVGYSGGQLASPTYEDVCTDRTGHAEVVQVTFDPAVVSYERLLEVFWNNHDPTQLNRQGPDVGSSYRSVIFYSSDEQQKISLAYIAQLDAAHVFKKPIVTQVAPLTGFYVAESYHQHFADNNPGNQYILICDRPKIEALKKQFPELFQEYKGK